MQQPRSVRLRSLFCGFCAFPGPLHFLGKVPSMATRVVSRKRPRNHQIHSQNGSPMDCAASVRGWLDPHVFPRGFVRGWLDPHVFHRFPAEGAEEHAPQTPRDSRGGSRVQGQDLKELTTAAPPLRGSRPLGEGEGDPYFTNKKDEPMMRDRRPPPMSPTLRRRSAPTPPAPLRPWDGRQFQEHQRTL